MRFVSNISSLIQPLRELEGEVISHWAKESGLPADRGRVHAEVLRAGHPHEMKIRFWVETLPTK
jgi:hypothetical protein